MSSSAELPGCPGTWLCSGLAAARLSIDWTRAMAAVTVSPWGNGQPDRRRQSATNDRNATWNPCAWTAFMASEDSPGSTAPSSTSARTWLGNSCAYQVPRYVP